MFYHITDMITKTVIENNEGVENVLLHGTEKPGNAKS